MYICISSCSGQKVAYFKCFSVPCFFHLIHFGVSPRPCKMIFFQSPLRFYSVLGVVNVKLQFWCTFLLLWVDWAEDPMCKGRSHFTFWNHWFHRQGTFGNLWAHFWFLPLEGSPAGLSGGFEMLLSLLWLTRQHSCNRGIAPRVCPRCWGWRTQW